ncbi:unnamed protein product [Cuscuta campestris]|uniref:RING-CH-type domain-containing protein n=1 Tax=Cuscuta campestris TaxID=132261 RepID=A0A484NI07_9ASTE|nr:unnamed protein product [Cuscuta campestris]
MQSLGKSNLDLETGGDGGRSSGEELCGGGGVAAEKGRRSSAASECLVDVDLESGDRENEGHLGKPVRDCRICHLGLDAENPDSGLPIELGCSCKDDLAVAHKHCAEAWFKIRGNKTCEICGSIAQSVVDINDAEHDPEHLEQSSNASTATVTTELPGPTTGSRDFWQGHRFLNFLLACMVFAFVISWLFHFNVPS